MRETWTGTCNKQGCKTPSTFLVSPAKPQTISVMHCGGCHTSYRLFVDGVGRIDFAEHAGLFKHYPVQAQS